MLNIGFGNMLNLEKVIAIVGPDSAPTRRMVQEARDEKRLIDATAGRRMRAVIVTESGSIVLSALQPETLAARAQEGNVK